MAVGGAKLALLLIHILSVAGNGYSSSQDNDHGGDDHEHRKKLLSSLKSGFVIGYVFSSVSIITIFMSYCVPWASLIKRKGNEVTMKTPMMTSLMERQEKKRKEAHVKSRCFLDTRLIWTRMSRFFRGKFSRHFHEVSRSREKGSDDRKIWIVAFNITSCGAQTWRQQSGQLSHSVHNSELEKLVIRTSFAALNIATRSFDQDNVIGVGRMGTMYRAAHPLMIVSLQLRESGERLLVYKYMPNGNLHDWLHPVKCNAEKLDWHVRVNIRDKSGSSNYDQDISDTP
ncbi:inactive receptor kinase RLK902 [Populus alba x Populus x berolinensis]|nr:inactive receptor kinase RLK902 [Populus alba x Populus x berolinensis]